MKQDPLLLSFGELTLSVPVTCIGVRSAVERRGEAWSVRLDDGVGVGVFLLETAIHDVASLADFRPSSEWQTALRFGSQLALEGADRYEVMLTFYPAGVLYPGVGGGLEDSHPSLWVAVVDRTLAPAEDEPWEEPWEENG